MADHDTGDAEGVAAAEASGATDSSAAESAGTDTDSSPVGGSTKSRILARKPLIAAGAVAVVVIAAITAFFVLWPDPPSRSAGGTPSGTGTGPWLRGTYQAHNDIQAPIGHYSNDHVLVLTSECPGCDATASGDVGTGNLHWNGAGWEASAPTDCGQVTSAFTIGPVLNGIAQQVSSNWSMCDVNVTTTLTRTGD